VANTLTGQHEDQSPEQGSVRPERPGARVGVSRLTGACRSVSGPPKPAIGAPSSKRPTSVGSRPSPPAIARAAIDCASALRSARSGTRQAAGRARGTGQLASRTVTRFTPSLSVSKAVPRVPFEC